MLKKFYSVIMIVLVLFSFSSCNNNSGVYNNVIDVEEDRPSINYSDSREITKDEVSSFLESYKEKLNETIEPCVYASQLEDGEITYDEAIDIDKSLCGPLFNMDESHSLEINIITLEDIILNFVFEDDTIQSSTDIIISNSRGLIDFGDDALNYILYREDKSRFSQTTLSIIDGELYFEEYIYSVRSMSESDGDSIYYSHYVYYENHYQIHDTLHNLGYREHFEKDLKTSEFYYFKKNIDYPHTLFYFGNNKIINTINYENNETGLISVMSTVYKDDLFSMSYRKVVEPNQNVPSILEFSALELPGWDRLKGGSDEFFMYDGDEITYPEYTTGVQGQNIMNYFPAIVIEDYELERNSLKIDDASVDLSVLKENIDYLSDNYEDILVDYEINLELLSLDDYIDEFVFIEEMGEEYFGE